MASLFSNIPVANPIEVFAVSAKCNEDTFPQKVNLSVGAYRSEEGKPWVLPAVHAAEIQMANDDVLNHEYLPVQGLVPFREAAMRVVFGPDHSVISENRVAGFQSVGGTGALRIGLEFLFRHVKTRTAYVSKPTWGNHNGILKAIGYTDIRDYSYWDATNRTVDMKSFTQTLQSAESGSVVILHGCAHNPTGSDPTKEQWKEIADICRAKKIIPFFDLAYQGFATGDLDQDAYAVRMFASMGFEMMCAQSFSKNFGLYNERIGHLNVVVSDSGVLPAVRSQMELVIRTNYSNPSNHGARIVSTILNNPALCQQWKENLKSMADRIINMRQKLHTHLKTLGTPGSWDHIIHQIGMFSFTGLTVAQAQYMVDKHHCYLLKNGRINMCGLTSSNVEYVARAIHDSVINAK